MLIDRRDVNFLMSWLDMDGIIARERYATLDRTEIDAILDLAEQIAEKDLKPHLRAGDSIEPQMNGGGGVSVLPDVKRAVTIMADAGVFGTVFDSELGGLQLPHIVHFATLGILMSGNLATASFALLTVANARLLATYASEAQIRAFVLPQIAGTTMGTMCMSEPQAGSSLGDIHTRALADGEDELGQRYRINGGKMWISAGDHDVTANIVHLVLAKIPNEQGELEPGTRGISLFIVPKILPDGQENDVAVAGMNHKLGYRALPNCALNFGEGHRTPDNKAGAIGWIVGAPGSGLPQMFHMMNEARISVGLAASILACRGYQMSLEYARDRRQGRRPGDTSGQQIPIIEHTDVRRMLLSQRALAQGALSLVLFSARLLDDEKTAPTQAEREEASSLLGLLTPITKSWPSELGQISLHHALQIHGGAGYTRDFDIELLYRDNRINPIHEGTTGIQAIDLVGRKLRKDKGAALGSLAQRIRRSIDEASLNSLLAPCAAQIDTALTQVEQAAGVLLTEECDTRALANATPFLFAVGHLVVGWLWLDQAHAANRILAKNENGIDRAHLSGRIRACRYFAETELPAVATWLGPVRDCSTLALEASLEEF